MSRDRKRWILSVPVKGELWLDSGAVTAVRDHKKSLFAAGILKITGDFAAQDAIVLCDSNGYEFARGLCNYTLKEVQKVQVCLAYDLSQAGDKDRMLSHAHKPCMLVHGSVWSTHAAMWCTRLMELL